MPLEFDTLDSALSHPDMREAFRTFLAKEFSSENLDFLEAVDSFKVASRDNTVSDQALSQRASQISATFVGNSAGRQVNLAAENVVLIQAELASMATKNRGEMSTMFDVGTGEVTELMRRDTFQRFKKSDVSKTTVVQLTKIEDLEAQVEKLKTSKAEQAKAFFQGGTKKVTQDLENQIVQAKATMDLAIFPNGHAPPAPLAPVLPMPQVQAPVPAPVVPAVVAQPAPVVAAQPPPQHDDLAVEDMSMEEFTALQQGQQGRTRGVEPGVRTQGVPQEQEGPEEEVSEGMAVEEMSMEEFTALQQGQQGRTRGVEPGASAQGVPQEQEGPKEEVSEGMTVEEMSMDELAAMQQGRSRAVNSGVKPEGPVPGQKEPGHEVSGAKKSVRESMGKKADAPSVSEKHGRHM